MVRLLGKDLAARHFPKALPWVFDHFARPVNQLRQEHGLPPLGSLPEVLTAGDYTLFPDVPGLVPTAGLPPNQHYLGPVLWSPSLPEPVWWSTLDDSVAKIYVTLGSSGKVDALPVVIEALRDLSVTVMLSTAGRARDLPAGPNFRVAEYLPGDLAARQSALVISNGGSTTGYQALAQGTPVVGIPFNLDQYLAMQAIEQRGAGVTLRSGSLSVAEVRAAVALVLADTRYQEHARQISVEMGRHDSAKRFAAFVERITAPRPRILQETTLRPALSAHA
jgi:UDP:flavonoid glycosyltransferase YjiC (YdhE family)